jgi:hypothetical protein
MAEQVRQGFGLPTLRFSLQFVKREPFVQIRAHVGRDELAVESVSAADVGIRERLSIRGYRGVQFRLPLPVIQRLADALHVNSHDDTLWLQIDRSAGFLAVVPWERLLAPVMQCPLLRVPNFLVDPDFLDDRLDLAICASAPAAKEFYPVADFTISLIERVQQAVAQGTDIHVFADRDAFRSLQDRFPSGSETSCHRVTVYDPDRAAPFGAGDSVISESETLNSPWLHWMKAELGDRGIEAVHFICPGFFNSEHGSLALARSPLDNTDEAWSHFVGGRELCAFLDDLGAGAVAFGAPYADIWALGLRLLADELAWTRPGPIILYEAQGPLDTVGHAYGFLFGGYSKPPTGRGELLLYCHPRRLEGYLESLFFEAAKLTTAEMGHEWMEATRQVVASKPSSLEKRALAPEPAVPRWARANQLMIEQSLLDLSGRHGATAHGSSDALRFLSELQSKFIKEST